MLFVPYIMYVFLGSTRWASFFFYVCFSWQYWVGKRELAGQKCNILVMELLGPDMEDLLEMMNRFVYVYFHFIFYFLFKVWYKSLDGTGTRSFIDICGVCVCV